MLRELLSDHADHEPLQRSGDRACDALAPEAAARERLGRSAGNGTDQRPADERRGHEERAGERDARPPACHEVEPFGERRQRDEDERGRNPAVEADDGRHERIEQPPSDADGPPLRAAPCVGRCYYVPTE